MFVLAIIIAIVEENDRLATEIRKSKCIIFKHSSIACWECQINTRLICQLGNN